MGLQVVIHPTLLSAYYGLCLLKCSDLNLNPDHLGNGIVWLKVCYATKTKYMSLIFKSDFIVNCNEDSFFETKVRQDSWTVGVLQEDLGIALYEIHVSTYSKLLVEKQCPRILEPSSAPTLLCS